MQKYMPPDITRIILQALGIGILIAATFRILMPFLPSILWAAMIVTATWPLLLKLEKGLWGKRNLATALMTTAVLVVFILPFSLAVFALVDNAHTFGSWVKALAAMKLPALPERVSALPVIGHKLAAVWQDAADIPEAVSGYLAPYAGTILSWFISQAGSMGIIAIQFMLTVVITAVLYSRGEVAAVTVIRFAGKLGGRFGEEAVLLAVQTIRGVAAGVIGTALIQSIIGGIGLAASGVPGASMLTAVMFMMCVAQLPPALVLVPAVIWLYYGGHNAWGTVLLVCTVFISTIDSFIRPLLVRKGADLPLFLVFAGVIGGLVTFGIVGLFIGPVVLAVTYRLFKAWIDSGEAMHRREPKIDSTLES